MRNETTPQAKPYWAQKEQILREYEQKKEAAWEEQEALYAGHTLPRWERTSIDHFREAVAGLDVWLEDQIGLLLAAEVEA